MSLASASQLSKNPLSSAAESEGYKTQAASPISKVIPEFRSTRMAMLRATTVEELTGILKECRERIKAIEI